MTMKLKIIAHASQLTDDNEHLVACQLSENYPLEDNVRQYCINKGKPDEFKNYPLRGFFTLKQLTAKCSVYFFHL